MVPSVGNHQPVSVDYRGKEVRTSHRQAKRDSQRLGTLSEEFDRFLQALTEEEISIIAQPGQIRFALEAIISHASGRLIGGCPICAARSSRQDRERWAALHEQWKTLSVKEQKIRWEMELHGPQS